MTQLLVMVPEANRFMDSSLTMKTLPSNTADLDFFPWPIRVRPSPLSYGAV